MSNKRSQKKSKVSNSVPKKATPKLRVQQKATKAPIARAAKVQNRGAHIVAREGGGCIVTHSEMIGTLTSQLSTDFQLLKRLRINPGSVQTFPWLSRMSPNYEMFKFHKVHFRFETRSPTTLGGALIMAPDYDSADGLSGNDTEQSLYNNRGAVDDAVWKQIILKLDPSCLNKMYKSHVIMADGRFETTKQDQKTIDPAQVFIGTDCLTANPLGKLFVDYSVELMVPSARTEVLGGGGSLEFTDIPVTALNAGILRKLPLKTGTDEIEPVAQFLSELVDKGVCSTPSDASPQYTILRFLKDYQGVFSQAVQSGPGVVPFTTGASLFVTPGDIPGAANVIPSTSNSTLQEKITSISNGSLSPQVQAENWKVSGRAGDFLKVIYQAPFQAATNLVRVEHILAAASLASLVI